MPLFGVQAAGGDDGGGGNDGWDLSGASSGGNQGPDEGVADPLNNGGIVYLETEGDPEDAFDNRPGYSGEDTGSYEGRGYQSDEGGSYQQEEAVEEPSNNDQQQPASILYEFDENDNLIVDLIEDNEFEFEDIFLEGTGCQLPYFVLEFESDISANQGYYNSIPETSPGVTVETSGGAPQNSSDQEQNQYEQGTGNTGQVEEIREAVANSAAAEAAAAEESAAASSQDSNEENVEAATATADDETDTLDYVDEDRQTEPEPEVASETEFENNELDYNQSQETEVLNNVYQESVDTVIYEIVGMNGKVIANTSDYSIYEKYLEKFKNIKEITEQEFKNIQNKDKEEEQEDFESDEYFETETEQELEQELEQKEQTEQETETEQEIETETEQETGNSCPVGTIFIEELQECLTPQQYDEYLAAEAAAAAAAASAGSLAASGDNGYSMDAQGDTDFVLDVSSLG
tara:strand:+ start:1678 stop:3060 length:1383 start_codon:yes stop_codon:yes gene_type:complete